MSDEKEQTLEDTKLLNELETIIGQQIVEHDSKKALTALYNLFGKWDGFNKNRGNKNKVFDASLCNFISAARKCFGEKPASEDFVVMLYLMLKFIDYRGYMKDKDNKVAHKLVNDWHQHIVRTAAQTNILTQLLDVCPLENHAIGQFFAESLGRYIHTQLCVKSGHDKDVIHPQVEPSFLPTLLVYPFIFWLVSIVCISQSPSWKGSPTVKGTFNVAISSNFGHTKCRELDDFATNSLNWMRSITNYISDFKPTSGDPERFVKPMAELAGLLVGMFSRRINPSCIVDLLEAMSIDRWATIPSLNQFIAPNIESLLKDRDTHAPIRQEKLRAWVSHLNRLYDSISTRFVDAKDKDDARSILFEPIAKYALQNRYDTLDDLVDIAGDTPDFYRALLSASLALGHTSKPAELIHQLVSIKAVASTAAVDLAMKMIVSLFTRSYSMRASLDGEQIAKVKTWLKIFVCAANEAPAFSDGTSSCESDDWLCQFVVQPYIALLDIFVDQKFTLADFLKCILSAKEFVQLADSAKNRNRWKEYLYSTPKSVIAKFGMSLPIDENDARNTSLGDFVEDRVKRLVQGSPVLVGYSSSWPEIYDLETAVGISAIYDHLASCSAVLLFEALSGKRHVSRALSLRAAASQLKMAVPQTSKKCVALPLLHVAALLCDEISQFVETEQPEVDTIEVLAQLKERASAEAEHSAKYSDRLGSMILSLRHLYEAFTSKITLRNAQRARNSLKALVALRDVLQITIQMSESDLDRQISRLKALVASCTQRKRLSDWLRDNASDLKSLSKNAEDATEESLGNATKEELEAIQSEFSDCSGLSASEYDMLLFFFSRQSALLFNFVSTATDDVGTIKAISWALGGLNQFLKSISDDDSITLANVTAIAATMNQFKHSLEEELNVVSDFLKGSKLSSAVIDQRRQRLGNALELVKLCQLWSQAQGFFAKYRLTNACPPSALDNIVAEPVQKPESINLDKAHKLLVLAKEILGDRFRSFHLKLLNTLIVRSEVVMFFLNEGIQIIRNRIELLSSDCQGDNSAMIILDNVTAVLKTLEPVVDFIAHRKKFEHVDSDAALRRFFDHITAGSCLSQTEDAFDRQLKQIEVMAERLAEIRMLISQRSGHSLEALIPYVKKLAQVGYFRSCLSTGELILLRSRDGNCRPESDEAESASRIQDAVRSMKVFLDQDDLGKKDPTMLQAIKDFADINAIANSIHHIRLTLKEGGHPKYQIFDDNITQPAASPAMIEENRVKTQESSEIWIKLLSATLKRQPRLQMLNRTQLARLLLLCDKLYGANCSKYSDKLMPFVMACFPEISAASNHDSEGLMVFMDNLEKAGYATFTGKRNSEVLEVEKLLEIAERLLSVISQLFKQGGEIRPPFPAASGTHIIDATELRESGLLMFRLLLQLNDSEGEGRGVPHPSQVLWCSENTSQLNLANFLKRSVTPFAAQYGLVFYLLNVDCLSLHCRETLTRWLSRKFVKTGDSQLAPSLKIVFSRDVGMELFSFLKKVKYTPVDVAENARHAIDRLRPLGSAVRTFQVFSAPAGSGKTEYLRQHLMDLRQAGTIDAVYEIAVSENFTPQMVSAAVSPNQSSGILLKISGYAPLDIVDSVLQQLLVFGVFWHDDAADAWKLDEATTHLHIFCELNPGPEENSSSTTQIVHSSVEDMLNQLPSIAVFAKRTASLQPKFSFKREADSSRADMRLTSAFVSLLRDGTSDQTLSHSQVVAIQVKGDDDHAASIISKHIDSLPNCAGWNMRQRMVFARLLSERVKWFLEYARTRTSPEFPPDPRENLLLLWRALHAEVVELCRLTAFGTTSTPMICRSAEWPQDYDVVASDSKLLPPWVNQMRSESRAIDVAEARSNPGRLRQAFGLGLGLADSSKMFRITSAMQYVLTPELALRLLQLHQFRTARRNCILSGRTGTGKTQLLNLYSLIVNSHSSLLPDILDLVPRAVKQIADGIVEISSKPMYSKWVSTFLQRQELGDAAGHYIRPENLIRFLENVCTAAQENKTVFLTLAKAIQSFAVEFLTKYYLVKRTSMLESVMQAAKNPSAVALSSPEEVIKLVYELLRVQPAELFFRIELHGQLSHKQIHAHMKPAIARANEVLRDGLKVIVFCDEFNTSQAMAVMKEILCDHALDGVALPENLFVVAAMNPHERVDSSRQLNNEPVVRAAFDASDLVYRVRPIPKSLQLLTLLFEDPTENDSASHAQDLKLEMPHMKDFVHMYAKLNAHYFGLEYFAGIVYEAHRFVTAVASTHLDRDHPSTRDLMRSFRLFHFFTHSTSGRLLIDLKTDLIALQPQLLHPIDLPAQDVLSWSEKFDSESGFAAMVVSIMLVYGLRLPRSLRSKFDDFMANRFRSIGCALIPSAALLERARRLFSASNIPTGIAPTAAILENLFAVVCCCEAKVPLVIKGPPGCSKTLSFTIAADNMKGPGSSRPFYQLLHQISTFRYQCSVYSTDKEIESVYEAAERRQTLFAESASSGRTFDRSVVFLDEGGLPIEARNAMKVIHYKLDNPAVSTVICSNRMLDAAKSNRALLVVRDNSADDESELLPLARGIFGIAAEENEQDRRSSTFLSSTQSFKRTELILRSIARAFRSVNSLPAVVGSGLVYQRRDYIHLLRHLYRITRQGHTNSIDSDSFMHSLQRHLSGLPIESFKTIARHFFGAVNSALAEAGFLELKMPQVRSTLEIIKDSLSERIGQDENPNTSSFRYMMIIDPTSNESAISLLRSRVFDSSIASKIKICALGDFDRDRDEAAHVEVISQVKNAMAEGHTAILINSEPIQTSFYDVFNRHFSVEYVRAPRSEEENLLDSSFNMDTAERQVVQYTAKLAVGSVSRSCLVHPDFKVIVHVPAANLNRTLDPFLDRFEKYRISLEEIFHDEVSRFALSSAEIQAPGSQAESVNVFQLVADGCVDMIEKLHIEKSAGSLLCGISPKESVYSLLLQGLERSVSLGADTPLIPPALQVRRLSKPSDQSLGLLSEKERVSHALLEAIRTANLHILQSARPEAVYLLRKFFSPEYLRQYFLCQEHFSCVRLFHHILTSLQEPQQQLAFPVCPHWVIFTRSSPDLVNVASGADITSLVPPQMRKQHIVPHSLSSFKSAAECEQRVKASAESADICFFFVDARECTAKQLSFLCGCVNQYSSADQAVFVVVHFPAESLLESHSYFTAVYGNGFDYAYVDSLGLIAEDDMLNVGDSQEKIDIHWWLAKACGIDSALDYESGGAALSRGFRPLFKQLINDVCSGRPNAPPAVPKMLSAYPRSVAAYKSAQDLRKAAIELFSQRPEFMDAALSKFVSRWSRTELHRVLDVISSAIRSGQPVGSFLRSIGSAMQCHLQATVAEVISKLFSHFTVDRVYHAHRESWQERLVLSVIQAVSPPPLRDPLAHLQAKAEVYANLSLVPELVMFHAIAENLKQIGETARQTAARSNVSLSNCVHQLLSKSIMKNAIAVINGNTEAFQQFASDSVRRLFSLQKATGAVLAAAKDLMLSFCSSQTVESIFLLYLQNPDLLRAINAQWMPLLQLDPVVTKEELLDPFHGFDASDQKAALQEIPAASARSGISLLWKRFLVTLQEKRSNARALEAWISCCKLFVSRLGSGWKIAGLIADGRLLREYQMITTIVQIHVTLAAHHQDLDPFLDVLTSSQFLDVISSHTEPHPLDILLLFSEVPQAKLALQDIVQSLLCPLDGFDESVSASTGRAALRTLFELLAAPDQVAQNAYRALPIRGKWSQLWVSNVLFAFMTHSTVHWVEAAIDIFDNVFSTIIPDVNQQRSAISCCDSAVLRFDRVTADKGVRELGDLFAKQADMRSVFPAVHLLLSSMAIALTQYYRSRQFDLRICCEIIKKSPNTVRAAAASCAALMELSRLISSSPKQIDDVLRIWTESTRAVVKDLLSSSPARQLWLLSSLTERDCLHLLREMKRYPIATSLLNLESWKLVSDVTLLDASTFSFTVHADPNDPFSQEYRIVKSIVLSAKKPHDVLGGLQRCVDAAKQGQANLILRLRMHLFLVCYKEYFDMDKSCEFVRTLLEDKEFLGLLRLSATEADAFRFICSGSPEKSLTNPIIDVMSRRGMKADEERPAMSLLLVNIMATCLACPESTNHMQPRIFNPQALASHRSGPGAAEPNRDFRDCYYQVHTDGSLQNSTPPVMNNNKFMRLSINSLAWAPLLWHILLYKDAGAATIRALPHFLNFWSQDGPLRWRQNDRNVQRNQTEMVASYLFDRAATFLRELSFDADATRLRVHPNLFLSESLCDFVRLFHGPTGHNPPASRALFSSVAEVLPYEALWQSIFDRVLESYPQRSSKFRSLADRSDARQVLISSSRERLGESFASPVLEISTIRGGMKQPLYVPSPNRRGQQDLDPTQPGYLIYLYFDIRHRLGALQSLPCFVSFYQLLYSSLSHRITEEQAREFSVPTAIDYLERCFGAEHVQAACTTLRESWKTFKKEWNAVAEALRNLRLCPNAAAFEGEVQLVSDDTKVLSLISAKSSSTGELQAGSIAMLVKDLLETQRDLVEAAQGAISGGSTTGETLDLSISTQGSDFYLLLFGSDFSEAQFNSYASCCAELDDSWHVDSLQVNSKRLIAFLAARAIGKGRDFDTSKLTIPFPFALAELSKLEPESAAAPPSGVADIEASVRRLLSRYAVPGKLAFLGPQSPLTELELRQLDVLLKDYLQSDLLTVGRALLRMLRELTSLYEDENEFMLPSSGKSLLDTFQVMSGEPAPDLLTKFAATIDKLQDFISVLCNAWHAKEDELFTDIPPIFSNPLPEKVVSNFRMLQRDVLQSVESPQERSENTRILQEVVSFASDVFKIVNDRKLLEPFLKPAFLTSGIASFINRVNGKLSESNVKLFSILVDESVQFRHYVKYAQRMHAFVAFLREQLIACKMDHGTAGSSSVYSEKLPVHIADIHKRAAQRIVSEDMLQSDSTSELPSSQYYPFDMDHAAVSRQADSSSMAEEGPFALSETPNVPVFDSRLHEELYCYLLALFSIPEVFRQLRSFCERWTPAADKILRAQNEASDSNFALSIVECFRAAWKLGAPSKRLSFAIRAIQYQLNTLFKHHNSVFTSFLLALHRLPDDSPALGAETPLACMAEVKKTLSVAARLTRTCSKPSEEEFSLFPMFNYSMKDGKLELSTSDFHLHHECSLPSPCLQAEISCRKLPSTIMGCLPSNRVTGITKIPVPQTLWLQQDHPTVKLPMSAGYRLVSFCVRELMNLSIFSKSLTKSLHTQEFSRHPSSGAPMSCAAGVVIHSKKDTWHFTSGQTVFDPQEPEWVIYVLDPEVIDPSVVVKKLPETSASRDSRSELASNGHLSTYELAPLDISGFPPLSASMSSSVLSGSLSWSPVVIQVRARDSKDRYEFDLEQPSFSLLKELIATELEVEQAAIKKISRTDDVVVRKDADVKRLKGTCQLVVDL